MLFGDFRFILYIVLKNIQKMPYKKITGIYRLLNKKNNKCYIGSGLSVKQRFSTHKRLLSLNKHFNNHLQSAWNKYGEKNFIFEILEEVPPNLLKEKEEFYIKMFNSNNNKVGYNKRLDCSTNLGIKASSETKEKLRKSHLGHKRSAETNQKIINSQYKKVCLFDINGNYIKTFNSILEGSLETSISRQNISMCCRKIVPWAKKTFWCYENEKNNFTKPEIKKRNGGWINGKREKRN